MANCTTPPVIITYNLSKCFMQGSESIGALQEVSLTITAGEFVAITGPSGSGKSTLLYLLGLLDQSTSGTYTLFNRATELLGDNERALLRNQALGFVFQSFHLLPRASALRNVMMPLIYSGSYQNALPKKEREQRATEALVRVGLKDRLYHLPSELSGGQSQRVAIARALVNKPKLLLADEPTGNLDSKVGNDIIDLFESLNQEGLTVLMVTHDQRLAQRPSRRILMRDGRVEDCG
jgi:putative ABC transport system ATP-binding protein